MTLRRSEAQQNSPSIRATTSAFNSPLPNHGGFSTRTRLRPGGPANSITSSNFSSFLDNPSSYNKTTPKNHDSLPTFEEFSMKTMNPNQLQNSPQHNFLLNRRPYFSTMMKSPNNLPNNHPPTPLVKQKTSGCSSPRVQMYRTRVVYSDAKDAIKAQEAAV